MDTTTQFEDLSPEQLRQINDVQARAIVDNLIKPVRDKLKDGLVPMPVNAVLNQIQYLQNIALPNHVRKHGEGDERYKFYRGLVDSLIWAIVNAERADYFARLYGRQKQLFEFVDQKCRHLESEISKYHIAESAVIDSGRFEDLIADVKKRVQDLTG